MTLKEAMDLIQEFQTAVTQTTRRGRGSKREEAAAKAIARALIGQSRLTAEENEYIRDRLG